MRCPRCRDFLVGVEHQEVEIDFCPEDGLWLDLGELETLMGGPSLAVEPVEGKVKIDCPRCRERMELVRHAASEVTLDRCTEGCGLWLDRGEFRRILAAEGDASGALSPFLREIFKNVEGGAA